MAEGGASESVNSLALLLKLQSSCSPCYHHCQALFTPFLIKALHSAPNNSLCTCFILPQRRSFEQGRATGSRPPTAQHHSGLTQAQPNIRQSPDVPGCSVPPAGSLRLGRLATKRPSWEPSESSPRCECNVLFYKVNKVIVCFHKNMDITFLDDYKNALSG